MSTAKSFLFEKARRVTARETEAARKAIEKKLGAKRPRRGRPSKGAAKYQPVSIRLSPKVLIWAKQEARRRGVGYQTVINETLLKASARVLLRERATGVEPATSSLERR
ncbi:MAG: BrnA antitoxin family protein [Deltaproteobacteria bacterium]|nr:BrnA antitoxin family protein [Deltaproteobacteria bacterium]